MAKARVAAPRISPADAKAMVDSGEAMILDVVASHVYPSMTRSIAGAVRIAPEEVEARMDELPRDRAIIAYCT